MFNLEQELLDLYLPDIDWTRYEIVKIDRIEDENIAPYTGRVSFYVVEKNVKPNGYENKKIVSKWFYEYKKIRDFQVRTKVATLHIKRRKWYCEEENKTISEDLNVNYKSTHAPEDLLFFFNHSLNDEKWV